MTGPGYENTDLWRSTLAAEPDDPNADVRQMLRAAYLSFRERAAILAAEIPQDLREFTVHDATHIDALWETADVIGGDALKLTPTEAFVFGGACLLHDLGMGLAAYPGGVDELRSRPEWSDAVSAAWRDFDGMAEEGDQFPDEVLSVAKRQLLRDLHAERAESLAMISWSASGSGAVYYLIDDVNLRTTFGPLIGKIAASHGWDVTRVADEFPSTQTYNAPVDCPGDWTVDPLKIACLLRLADASHLDARRAPGFLRAVRNIEGMSSIHWTFQAHLQRVRREDDRLIFSSMRPFSIEDADAWWLCFDTLQQVQKELREVDALLADRGKLRFKARTVFGAESPFRLSETIPTQGWVPVDAQITIQDIPALVRKLGGEQLYGAHGSVALRELVQNAIDASLALKAVTGEQPRPVKIKIALDEDGYWLEVSDHGIGMSQAVLIGALLDFGTSYWGSELMRRESPGLLSSDFQPTGKYGIGFYSTFMLGERVSVTSRRHDQGQADTNVLDFRCGLASRPLLRKATPSEQLRIAGTTVRVLLDEHPLSPDGLIGEISESVVSLAELCEFLFPGARMDLHVVDLAFGEEQSQIEADDWKVLPAAELLNRVSRDTFDRPRNEGDFRSLASRLREIKGPDGRLVARCALSLRRSGYNDFRGVIATDGIRVTSVEGVAGLISASPTKASRNFALPVIGGDALSLWATEQATLLSEESRSTREAMDASSMVRAFYGSPGTLPLCIGPDGLPMTEHQVQNWAASVDEVSLFDTNSLIGDELFSRWNEDGSCTFFTKAMSEIKLGSSNLVVSRNAIYIETDSADDGIWPPPKRPREYARKWSPEGMSDFNGRSWWYWNNEEISGLIAEVLTRSWQCSIDQLMTAVSAAGIFTDALESDEYPLNQFVTEFGATAEGEVVKASTIVRFRRPAPEGAE